MIKKLLEELKADCEKILKSLQEQFLQISVGKLTPDTVKNIKIKFGNGYCPLIKLVRIEMLDQRTLKLILHDPKSASSIIEGFEKSDLGYTADAQNNTQILIKAPTITEEYKQQLQKACKTFGYQAILSLQELRNSIIDRITKKKIAELTSDDMRHRAKQSIEDQVKVSKKELEDTIEKKCKDLK